MRHLLEVIRDCFSVSMLSPTEARRELLRITDERRDHTMQTQEMIEAVRGVDVN